MKPQTFLARFGELADQPGGTRQLRWLVHNLAIRGRLTAQNAKDGDAARLLTDLDLKRTALAAERKASKLKANGDVRNPPFPAPAGWLWATFGQVTICRDGQRVPVSRAERAKRRGRYDYYGASGIIDKIDDYLFDEPLLLIGEDGANLLRRSTPIAFMAYGKYWVNNHAHVLDGLNEHYLRYVSIFINAIDLAPYVSGTAQPKMNQAKMNSIPVALPPLAEQKRIVAKVDELLTLCDELEAKQEKKAQVSVQLNKAALHAVVDAPDPKTLRKSWKRIEGNFDLLYDRGENVDELRQSIIDLALQGRLEPDAGDKGIVDGVVEEAASERTTAPRGRNPKVEPYLSPDDWSHELPPSWRWVRWGALTLGIESGWSPKCKATPAKSGEWGVLKVSAVSWGRFDAAENKALPAGKAPRVDAEVQDGDFLMSRANTAALVGRSVVVEHPPPHLMMSDKILRCYFAQGVSPWFINYVNRASSTRAHYMAKASGTSSSMKNISRDVVGLVPVPLPPPAMQELLVQRLDALMALCDDLEAKLKQADEDGERLMQAVVRSLVA